MIPSYREPLSNFHLKINILFLLFVKTNGHINQTARRAHDHGKKNIGFVYGRGEN